MGWEVADWLAAGLAADVIRLARYQRLTFSSPREAGHSCMHLQLHEAKMRSWDATLGCIRPSHSTFVLRILASRNFRRAREWSFLATIRLARERLLKGGLWVVIVSPYDRRGPVVYGTCDVCDTPCLLFIITGVYKESGCYIKNIGRQAVVLIGYNAEGNYWTLMNR